MDNSYLRVLHLNPSVYFSTVLQQAHAVVLAGGTMQPFRDLEQQLFHALPPGRLRTTGREPGGMGSSERASRERAGGFVVLSLVVGASGCGLLAHWTARCG